MHWITVDNLLLGTNMDTQASLPGIVKVMVSVWNLLAVDGYIYSLLVVFHGSNMREQYSLGAMDKVSILVDLRHMGHIW